MVGLASCSGKKVGYGIVRKGQPVLGTNKIYKSSNSVHVERDLSVSRDTGHAVNEPLNNPDWRRRRVHDRQENSTTDTAKQIEPLVQDIPPATLSPHLKLSSLQPYSTKRQSVLEEGLQKPTVKFGDPLSYNGDGKLEWGACSAFPGSHLAGTNSFNVVRHSKLHDQGDGRTLDLFGVVCSQDPAYGDQRCTFTRFSSGDDTVDDRFLHMISRKHTLTPDESQGHQLIAALEATEPTPRKVGRTPPNRHDTSQRSSCRSEQSLLHIDAKKEDSKSRRLTSKDSGFSCSSASKHDQHNGDDGLGELSSDVSGRRQHVLEQKDIAFRKLIKRLNGTSPQERRPVEQSRDSGYEPESLRAEDSRPQLTEPTPVPDTRRPTHSSGRRVKTASDFAVRYWPMSESRRGGDSTDSAGGDAPDKYNSLNPKAREFLSFSYETENMPCKGRRPALPSLISAGEQKVHCPWRDSFSSEAEHKNPGVTNSRFISPNGPLPVPYVNAASIPLLFQPPPNSNASLLGLIPLMPDAYKSPLGQPGVWPNDHATTAIPDACRPLQSNGYMHKTTQSASFTGPPSVTLQHKMSVPNLNVVPPVTQGNNSLPRRVAKPKQPNPRDQQEYEAWVEWRKATEPGYAMACKLRQQRRAQRNGPKVKPEAQPKTGSE